MTSLDTSIDKITMYFKKYTRQWVEDVKNDTRKLKNFQMELYKIPTWSPKKLSREYLAFIKMISKKQDASEEYIQYILYKIYEEHLNKLYNNTPLNYTIPTLDIFFWSIMKKIGMYHYNNPKNDTNSAPINTIVNETIQKYIPITSLPETVEPPFFYSFNTPSSRNNSGSPIKIKVQKLSTSTKNEITNTNTNLTSNNSKQNSSITTPSLNMIDPGSLENEYYNSEPNTDNSEKYLKNIIFKK